jgi:hypothetical protein
MTHNGDLPQPVPPPQIPTYIELDLDMQALVEKLCSLYGVEPKTYPGMGPEAYELHAHRMLVWTRQREAIAAELGALLVDHLTIDYRMYLDPM